MKTIRHTLLSLLLILTHLPSILTTNTTKDVWWHQPLTELYYKSTKTKVSPQVVQQTIQTFNNLNINNLSHINSIKAKNLGKRSLSSKKYELEVLKTYYLFTKIDNKQTLTQQEKQAGYNALTKHKKHTSTHTPTTYQLRI